MSASPLVGLAGTKPTRRLRSSPFFSFFLTQLLVVSKRSIMADVVRLLVSESATYSYMSAVPTPPHEAHPLHKILLELSDILLTSQESLYVCLFLKHRLMLPPSIWSK